VKIGFVGAGAVVEHHVAVLEQQAGVDVVAVCDLDEGRACKVATELDARWYTEWETMLTVERLEAVFVCTPPTGHAEPVSAALAQGLPVYVEKPLARTLADGLAIVAAWEASPAVCAVGYQWRSLDLLDDLRSHLGGAPPGMMISRSLGPTEGARRDLDRAASGSDASWFVDPRRSGGILFELGSHDIDLQLALAGPVESVQAYAGTGLLALAHRSAGELHDAVTVLLRFASGCLGAVHVAWSEAQRPPLYTLDVLGSDVALHLELDPAFELRGRAHGVDVSETGAVGPRVSSVTRFLDAVRGGDRGSVPCSPANALDTLQVALACETAIATGLRVTVPPVGLQPPGEER
jgi:myo-inositol 2-dehydrogenase / D-chiro-inositol 1-dehydrogenase